MSSILDPRIALAFTAGAAAAYVLATKRTRSKPPPAEGYKLAASPFVSADVLGESNTIATSGTLLLCTQNLAVSGANQVLLNLVEGMIWRGNVVLLSPDTGPFAKEFADLGVSVQLGSLESLLHRVPDVRLAICNTIMTAHLVVALGAANIPQMWILHEWWPPEMLVDELTKRNDKNTTAAVVKAALECCQRTVCVCRSQLELYKPKNGFVTFVGVPDPKPDWKLGPTATSKASVTFLCLGIVCPRKNQHWAVEVFKKWAGDRKDVRLLVVGARYVRQYEIDYVEKVKSIIGGDPRIELHDVTNDVDRFYRVSDALLFTSLNEVTPMVIAEAMMRALPVVTTDIAGIPEMLQHGVHGYVLPPDEQGPFVKALEELGEAGAKGQRRRLQMGVAAKKHALETFTNGGMVAAYRAAALSMAAPVILIDMDGVLVDWDAGFAAAWRGRSPIDRRKSYAMEDCVPPEHRDAALAVFHTEGFFRSLPPMEGGVEAVKRLAARGYRVFLCTAPVVSSSFCAGEKFEWVRDHLGPAWVSRIILTSDKTAVRGDVLIDDKPRITGAHHPVWQHLRFDAPYNLGLPAKHTLSSWAGVAAAVDAVITSAPSPKSSADAADDDDDDQPTVTKQAVAVLPDFSHLLPADYRKDYAAWRSGRPQGAKGELNDAMKRFAAMQDSLFNSMSEDFTEVSIYRLGYAGWRKGRAAGAKSLGGGVSQL